MAQSRTCLIAVNYTFERGCRHELGSPGSEGRGKAVQDCTPESLISCFLRKKEQCWPSAPVSLCPGAQTRAQEEGGGWQERWVYTFGSFHAAGLFLLTNQMFWSYQGDYKASQRVTVWEVWGQLPLCSCKGYHLTYLCSRHRVIDVFSTALTASYVPVENGEREIFLHSHQ